MSGLNLTSRPPNAVIPPLVALAPMAGVSDVPFRLQVKAFGGAYCVSEMVASDALARERRDMVRRAAGSGRLTPLVIQIAGRETHWMGEGARLAEQAGAAVIDLNMGCPAKQVTHGLSGSALMRDPDHALRLIEATVNATSLPVTLKMRLGWDHGSLNAADIARRAEAAGVQMFVIHGRTRCQFYKDAADWRAIGDVVRAVSVPVLANGDIATVAGAREAMKLSGAAGVMVGRAAQGKPWLPAAIEHALRNGGEAQAPSNDALLTSLLELYNETLDFYDHALGLRVARKHIAWTIDAVFGETARGRRRAICTMTDTRAVKAALVDLFNENDNLKAAA